jgi:signal transduction histidine kinase
MLLALVRILWSGSGRRVATLAGLVAAAAVLPWRAGRAPTPGGVLLALDDFDFTLFALAVGAAQVATILVLIDADRVSAWVETLPVPRGRLALLRVAAVNVVASLPTLALTAGLALVAQLTPLPAPLTWRVDEVASRLFLLTWLTATMWTVVAMWPRHRRAVLGANAVGVVALVVLVSLPAPERQRVARAMDWLADASGLPALAELRPVEVAR